MKKIMKMMMTIVNLKMKNCSPMRNLSLMMKKQNWSLNLRKSLKNWNLKSLTMIH